MNWKQRIKGIVGRLLYVFTGAILATVLIAATLSINPAAQKFGHIIRIIQESYVDPTKTQNEDELYETAVGSILERIGEKHGGYLSSEKYQAMQESISGNPTFTGVGVDVGWYEEGNVKGLFINDIFDGPAKLAGLKVKDVITAVDGNSYNSVEEYINKIKGPAGTFVTLTIRREGVDLGDLTIERDHVSRQNVTSTLLPDDVIYVRIKQFNVGSAEDIESHVYSRIAELESQDREPVGLIVDGRYNPGGLLSEAHAVSDLFLPKGKQTVRTDGTVDEMDMKFVAEVDPLFGLNFPIVVLVNGYCASACEILAGATKRHATAKIIGVPTYGKGSVQTIIPLYDGSALKLTTALYYAGGDIKVDGNPITPDFNVGKTDMTREETVDDMVLINSIDLENDEQLAKAHWWILFANTINPNWRYASSEGPAL